MALIFCPKCSWKPSSHHMWVCGRAGCGHRWHTFDTRGQCPRCLKQWTQTQCLTKPGGCGEYSPHEDWYHDEGGNDDRLRRLVEDETPVEAPREPEKVGAKL